MPHIAKRRGSACETRSGVSPAEVRSEIGSSEPIGGRPEALRCLIYTVKHLPISGVSPFELVYFPGFPKTRKV